MNIQTQGSTPATPLLDIDLLRSFAAIIDEGSFSAAAEKVGRSPSAISMQIKRLEEMTGAELLKRDARSVRLTSEGEILLGFARQFLELNRKAIGALGRPELEGQIRLGLPDDYGETVLPYMLRHFSERYPSVVVDVTMQNTRETLDLFDRGKVDVAVFSFDEEGTNAVGAECLFTDPLVWVGARGGTAHLRDPLPLSMWDESCVWRRCAVAALESVGRPWRIAYTCAHTPGQRAAVRAGIAIAPVSRIFAGDDVKILGEEDGLPPMSDYSIGMKLRDEPSEQAKVIADHLRAFFRELREKR
ncbi:LysR substrate-binding domain-containing protein [Fulvimarina sp. MAC8]